MGKVKSFFQNLGRSVTARSTRAGLNTMTSIVLLLGIVVMVNFIGNRWYKRFDFTKEKLFSLSDQSIKVIRTLKEPVKITGFYKSEERPLFDDLIGKYAYESAGKIESIFVDPDVQVSVTKQYGVKKYQTIIVESGKRETRVEQPDEEKLTNAIIKISQERNKQIYFLQGHDEVDLKSTDAPGYSTVKEYLTNSSYDVKEWLMLEKGTLPVGADVIVIAGPKKPYLEQEKKLIEEYLAQGKTALILLDPQTQTGLEPLLEKWGVRVDNDVVIDTRSIYSLLGGNVAVPIVTRYGKHPAVEPMRTASFFPHSRSLTVLEPVPSGVKVEPLAKSNPETWGEIKLQKGQKVTFDPKEDKQGPLTLGVAVTSGEPAQVAAVGEPSASKETEKKQGKKESRIVIFGDSDFASNAHFGLSGNSDLFLNLINWLAAEESRVSIRPKTAGAGRLFLSPGQITLIFYVTVMGIPLLMVLGGVSVWWRRRKL